MFYHPARTNQLATKFGNKLRLQRSYERWGIRKHCTCMFTGNFFFIKRSSLYCIKTFTGSIFIHKIGPHMQLSLNGPQIFLKWLTFQIGVTSDHHSHTDSHPNFSWPTSHSVLTCSSLMCTYKRLSSNSIDSLKQDNKHLVQLYFT